MAFKLSTILNPAPRSGTSSPAPPPASPIMGAQHDASTGSHETASSPVQSTMAQTVAQSLSIEPLVNVGATAKAGSSSPTVEKLRIASKSPELQHHQSGAQSQSPPASATDVKLDIAKQSGDTPTRQIPLFIPAQPFESQPSSHKLKNSPTPRESSPLVKEDPATPDEMALNPTITKGLEDPGTRAAVEAVLNEHGLRGTKKPSERKASVDPAPRKGPPKRNPGATKKGTAKKAPKKKKTGTVKAPKTSSKREQTGTPALSSSPAPADVDEEASDDESMVDTDSDEVYCICRKPDDHKYMIGCDGGCDNWFHGKCVNISEEDGKLIDKYICPNCEKKGIGITTWKPMCRREGCRKAARLANGITSKYCSDECGVLFMQQHLSQSNKEAQNTTQEKLKSAKRKATDDMMPSQRGGPMAPGVLKALLISINTATDFRALGDSILSKVPPEIQSSINDISSTEEDNNKTTNNNTITTSPETNNSNNTILTATEVVELRRTTSKKDDLRNRRTLLKERERFIAMVKEQHSAYADREGIKAKDVCGFDSRLSWGQEAFGRWRNSPAGELAFDKGALALPAATPPPPDVVVVNGTVGDAASSEAVDEDVEMVDMGGAACAGTGAEVPALVAESTLCTKKRCERHKQWARLMLEDVRYEEASLADQMREAERLEKQVRETALLRWREEQANKYGLASVNGVEVKVGS
jgi:COMPASS component SPP1